MSDVLERFHPGWPACLNELGPLPPPERLYVRGRPLDPSKKHVAIVGTRRPTRTGLEVAERMGRELAEAGFVIVSGLATGIDAAAHRAALRAGGWTVAVLGCGTDVVYPAQNRRLYREITERGTLVSEYPDETPAATWRFPERNRIVAGLSLGVVVVEGGPRSGALITANRALESNRCVFAVPGSVRNQQAVAPNELIRTSQATLVTEPKHVFEELAPGVVWEQRYSHSIDHPMPVLGRLEGRILELLDDTPVSSERIRREVEDTSGAVALALSCLEVRGLAVKRMGGYEVTGAGARVRAVLSAG